MAKTLHRRSLLAGVGVFALPAIARAQARPITLVHGFGPGGTTDAVARLVAERLGARLGRNIVVEPRPGAGGTIAAGQVSRAPADGNTLIFLVGAHAISPAMFRSLNYDSVGGFSFVGMIADYPFVLATSADHPVRSLAGLIERAKVVPEPMTYSTTGIGTTNHLAMEMLAVRAGIRLQHVPYRTASQGALDVMAKRIDFSIEGPASIAARLQDGSMRGLGVTSATRFFLTPDVPTFAEGGLPGYEVTTWSGLAGPPGLPNAMVTQLNGLLREILAEPGVVQKIRDQGSNPAPGTPTEFRARVESDIAKWSEVVRLAEIERT
ncbi:Bug family tripartite tricarboxylate transporter substrate binding protein [Humitalea sp. 24SJ18S-53]|uniref:Bug family tripartite tricarboxylate transporter substrate binding protein n=1 Tax=Humitalea sp. 24SJ18S-53 TaxID=3422307 RepID=UPI003D67C013